MSRSSAQPTVLHVTYADAVWGAEQIVLRLAPRLEQRGIGVVIAGPGGGVLEQAVVGAGLRFRALDAPQHGGLRASDGSGRRPGPAHLARDAREVGRSVRRLRHVISETGADVVHSHPLRAHLEVAVAGRTARVPTVVHLHDMVAPGAGRQVLGAACRVASLAIAISDAVAGCVPAWARGNVEVRRHGIDLERFSPGARDPAVRAELGAGEGDELVGILGRVDPRQQVDIVVEAMARVRAERPAARLTVVGAPHLATAEYTEALRRRAVELLGDAVRFVEPRPDVPDVIRALDVLVNASVAEPFGLTLVEAQACGVPVVAAASGGAPEAVVAGATGLVVAPGDVRALAAAIVELLDDPPRRARFGAAGRRHVEAHHDIEVQADDLAATYRRLSSRRR